MLAIFDSNFHNDRRFDTTLVHTLCLDICHTCQLAEIERLIIHNSYQSLRRHIPAELKVALRRAVVREYTYKKI